MAAVIIESIQVLTSIFRLSHTHVHTSRTDNKPVGHFNVPGDEAEAARTAASAHCYQPPCPVDEPDAVDKIRSFFETKFRLSSRPDDASDTECDDRATSEERLECRVARCERLLAARALKEVNLEHLVEHWRAGGFKRIVTMVGAGISTCKFCCGTSENCVLY